MVQSPLAPCVKGGRITNSVLPFIFYSFPHLTCPFFLPPYPSHTQKASGIFFGSVLVFGAPGSENLEMNGWQKNLLRSLNALKHPRLVSSFSLLVS